jgi:hypothetical protein
MRTLHRAVKRKIKSIGSNCRARCPVCAGPCIGAPERYLWRHTCLDLHQWVGIGEVTTNSGPFRLLGTGLDVDSFGAVCPAWL